MRDELGYKNLTNTQINYLQEMLDKVEPWVSPQILKERIIDWMREEKIFFRLADVSGNIRHCKVTLVFQDGAVIIFESKKRALLYSDLKSLLKYGEPNGQNIEQLFYRPKVILINLCDVQLRPVPRLNLSTGVIASYLREKNVAEVTIIDMQMGMDIETVVSNCKGINPDIIGMSVDFKEYDIAIKLLEKLKKEEVTCTKVLGNILPSLLTHKFLSNYPNALISYGEGEESWLDLALWKAKKIEFNAVSGIRYLEDGVIRQTPIRYIDMKDCQTPALDTLPDLVRNNGILTLELSRGCDYSACAFCPREHKTSFWRGMPSEIAVNQIEELLQAAERAGLPPFIYLADEEIVGELSDGSEYKRIEEISNLLIRRNIKCTLNASVRADSLYNPKKTIAQSEQMIHAWYMLKKAGLEKLFIGVESGSEEQLKRYGKGTTPEQNIIAIRTATVLGIKIRVGFVMFDPLMENDRELKQNMKFLARKDAVMRQVNGEKKDLLRIIEGKDERFNSLLAGEPIYRYVSYLFTGLEVFVKAPYFKKVKQIEKERNHQLLGTYDWELGKVKTEYLNKQIGILEKLFEEWTQKNYSLTYTLKCLAKNAPKEEQEFLYRKVFEYRELFYEMAVCILAGKDEKSQKTVNEICRKYGVPLGQDAISIMQQWEQYVIDSYLTRLQKEIDCYVVSKSKLDLIDKILREREKLVIFS